MLSRVLCQRGGAEDGRSLLLQPETAILCLSHTRSRSSILAASATVQIAPASWQVADPLLVSCRSPSPAQGGLASMGATMQAAAFDRFGGPDVLHVVNWTKPHPSADRVLVRVICASVNPIDVKIRQGQAFPFSSLTALPKVRACVGVSHVRTLEFSLRTYCILWAAQQADALRCVQDNFCAADSWW